MGGGTLLLPPSRCTSCVPRGDSGSLCIHEKRAESNKMSPLVYQCFLLLRFETTAKKHPQKRHCPDEVTGMGWEQNRPSSLFCFFTPKDGKMLPGLLSTHFLGCGHPIIPSLLESVGCSGFSQRKGIEGSFISLPIPRGGLLDPCFKQGRTELS